MNDSLHSMPSKMTYDEFMSAFQGIYEHSSWVAEAAWLKMKESTQPEHYDSRECFSECLKSIVENSSDEVKLNLLRLHPDLAGKAALAGDLTDSSRSEQAGAGLDTCTKAELDRFTLLNESYKEKFAFPFIMAVKGATKYQILEGFEKRIDNTRDEEFRMALSQVHKIARFRLEDK